MGLQQVIAGFVKTTKGTGSSSPELPVWAFQAADSSAPGSAQFTTDNAMHSGTGIININPIDKGSSSGWLTFFASVIQLPFAIMLTNGIGEVAVFQVLSSATVSGYTELTVNPIVVKNSWEGEYKVSFAPASSGITPCPDGTVTPVTSISTVKGNITAIS